MHEMRSPLINPISKRRNKKMKKKKNFLARTITMVALAALTVPGSSQAQQLGIKRTELQQHDLSISGREVIQTRVDIDSGVVFPKHTHPGEEIIYVLKGTLEYYVEGKPRIILKSGEVLFIPAGVVHAARNVGSAKASELATYIVEKGKPLLVAVR